MLFSSSPPDGEGIAQFHRTGVGLATNGMVLSTGASVVTLLAALLLLGVQTR